MDYSTINVEEAKRLLRTYVLPRTFQLSRSLGSACLGDPPGFPSYFVQHIYTQHGNSPKHDLPQEVIVLDGVLYVTDHGTKDCVKGEDWDAGRARYLRRLTRIWNRLPIDHPRVQAWIRSSYGHLGHCYADDSKPERHQDHAVIFPVPSYKLKSFMDDPRFSDEWRQKERAAVEQANKEIVEATAKLAIPENHMGYRRVHRFYPEHTPDLALIENPGKNNEGSWWETEAERPTPENCQPRSCGPHPVNKTWCQWCGWRAE